MTMQKFPGKGIFILLTGGSGFLGKAIVNELLTEDAILPLEGLRILDQSGNTLPADPRIEYLQGDIRNEGIVQQATAGIDLVIHTAAIVDWGTKSKKELMSVNFEGTKILLEAARKNGVKAFVYTSSLDVLFYVKPKRDIDEDHPYPEQHTTSYCYSKYLAEKAVMAANSPVFRTSILRPSDIYGEGDPYHIGSLAEMARGGFYVRLGNGKSRSQHVYVGNIAHAHILLSDAILNGNRVVSGKSYFITDGPGSNFFTFFDSIIEAAGYRIWPKNLWLPRGLAYTIGILSEIFALLARPIKYYHPKMSRFAVKYTCTDYTFNSKRAAQDFGFQIKYKEEVALERTLAYWKKERLSQ